MRLLRIKEVTEKTGLSKTAIYDNMNAGQFPRNISLGVRAVAWL
ncbi:AlpA family phage regulatory protein [Vibrio alginolyticus]